MTLLILGLKFRFQNIKMEQELIFSLWLKNEKKYSDSNRKKLKEMEVHVHIIQKPKQHKESNTFKTLDS